MSFVRFQSEEKKSCNNTKLFFYKDPEKFSIHLNKSSIIKLLETAAIKYEKDCLDKEPGEEGIKRRQEFYIILAKFKKQDSILLFSFQELARFYKKHKTNGRLMKLVENILLDSLAIQKTISENKELNDFYNIDSDWQEKLNNAIRYYSGTEIEMEDVLSIEVDEKPIKNKFL